MTKKGENLRETLQTHGLRYSRPREVILSYFSERDVHVSAEEVHQVLKSRGENLSLSTVYLNLGVLKSAGLVREFSGVGGEALYDSNVGPHHHLICARCSKVLDLPEVEIAETTLSALLRAQATSVSGWQVDEPSIGLQGVCPDCQASGIKPVK